MNKHDHNIPESDQPDHARGLELIRVLGLHRNRSNGRVETTHGDKTPVGLARTVDAILKDTWRQ